jgi:hypothetical protein
MTENLSCHTNHDKLNPEFTIYNALRAIYFALRKIIMKSKQGLIKTILRLDSNRSEAELEKCSDYELVLLKAKLQFEYDRHNINLFRKGYALHNKKTRFKV